MSRTVTEAPTSFPRWVAVASLGIALWLFFSNTVPALRERTELHALGSELVDLRRQYDAAIAATRLGSGANATVDLQSLLVAIDEQGFTPAELCAAYPQAANPQGTSAASGDSH